jgi:hypothetical protein
MGLPIIIKLEVIIWRGHMIISNFIIMGLHVIIKLEVLFDYVHIIKQEFVSLIISLLIDKLITESGICPSIG